MLQATFCLKCLYVLEFARESPDFQFSASNFPSLYDSVGGQLLYSFEIYSVFVFWFLSLDLSSIMMNVYLSS